MTTKMVSKNAVFLLKCMEVPFKNTIYPNVSPREGLLGHWLNQIHLNYGVPMLQIQNGILNKNNGFIKMH